VTNCGRRVHRDKLLSFAEFPVSSAIRFRSSLVQSFGNLCETVIEPSHTAARSDGRSGMPATLSAQRTTVSVEQLLDVIIKVISEAMGGRNTDHIRLRIAIWRIRGEPNWQARIDDASPTILATFFNARS
jgi:hypothetical protein